MKIIREGAFTPPEIRDLLYELLNEMRDLQNHHVEAWGREHVNPCKVCERFDAQKDGIRRSIKRFGGLPRFGSW